jgi:hypothetical protein
MDKFQHGGPQPEPGRKGLVRAQSQGAEEESLADFPFRLLLRSRRSLGEKILAGLGLAAPGPR